MCYKGMAYRGYLLPPVDFLTGVQATLPSFFGKDNVQQLQNEKDYRDLIRRLKKVPKQINQIIDLLKLGVQEGITYSNESMYRTKVNPQLHFEATFQCRFWFILYELFLSIFQRRLLPNFSENKNKTLLRTLTIGIRKGPFMDTVSCIKTHNKCNRKVKCEPNLLHAFVCSPFWWISFELKK